VEAVMLIGQMEIQELLIQAAVVVVQIQVQMVQAVLEL
jgi:hypothetical protein